MVILFFIRKQLFLIKEINLIKHIAMYELRKYHGNRVQSLTYDDGKLSFSVGIMSPGEYEFGSIKKEDFTVIQGSISSWFDGESNWKTAKQNEKFSIPEHKNFKLKANEVSAYICYYK